MPQTSLTFVLAGPEQKNSGHHKCRSHKTCRFQSKQRPTNRKTRRYGGQTWLWHGCGEATKPTDELVRVQSSARLCPKIVTEECLGGQDFTQISHHFRNDLVINDQKDQGKHYKLI